MQELVRKNFYNFARYLMLVFLLLAVPTFAQSGKGVITGTVVDTAGAAVPSAQLRLEPLGVMGTSSSEGTFALPEISAGKYVLSVPISAVDWQARLGRRAVPTPLCARTRRMQLSLAR